MTIEIKTGYAAFMPDNGETDRASKDIALATELSRIFKKICDDIAVNGRRSGEIIDSNGNNVGKWSTKS